MALTRFNGNVVPFASESTTDNRTVFGDIVQADDIDSNLNADFKKGWEIVGLNDNPTKQDFNAMGYTLGALTSYLYQMGIAEYNASQEYKLNAVCIGTDGTIYQSLVDANIGNALNDVSKWKNINNSFVDLVNNQSIDGIKNFVKSPIVPTPTTGTQAVNKDYVDASIALKTIATGTATFNSTTNNINLTGIGLGVEIGDVIQISGADDAKNNSDFTIEVITDANNIIVNQAHAGKGTTKNVATRASDTGVTVKLLAKWYNAPIGLGQGWAIVEASRNKAVLYSNNTNRTIVVSSRFSGIVAVGTSLIIKVDGNYIEIVQGETTNAIGHSVSAEVPAGSTYEVISGFPNKDEWRELR